MADISIKGHGSYEVESLTEGGAAWMWSNIRESESAGDGSIVASIEGAWYALSIADGATDGGLEVGINCVLYDGSY